MSQVVKRFVKCDSCGRETIAPKDWREVRDYYGNSAHACPVEKCQEWLNAFASENELELQCAK